MIERKLREYSWELAREMLPERVKTLNSYSVQEYNLFEKLAYSADVKSGVYSNRYVHAGEPFVCSFFENSAECFQDAIDLYNKNKQAIIDEAKIPYKQQQDIDCIKRHLALLTDKMSAYLDRLSRS